MSGVAPLLSGLDRDEFAGNDAPGAARAQRDDPAASRQAAPGGRPRDGKDDQFLQCAHVDVYRRCLVLPSAAGMFLAFLRVRIEVEPPAVGGDVSCTRPGPGELDLGERNDVLGAVFAPASYRQPAPFVAVVVNLDHRNRLSDDEAVSRQIDMFFEGLPEGPEFSVIADCVERDLFDQLVQRFAILAVVRFSRLHASTFPP